MVCDFVDELNGYLWFNDSKACVMIEVHKDGYFNLTNPFAYMNTAEENGNVDSATGIALKDIKAGEELMGTYKLENTKPRLEVIK